MKQCRIIFRISLAILLLVIIALRAVAHIIVFTLARLIRVIFQKEIVQTACIATVMFCILRMLTVDAELTHLLASVTAATVYLFATTKIQHTNKL